MFLEQKLKQQQKQQYKQQIKEVAQNTNQQSQQLHNDLKKLEFQELEQQLHQSEVEIEQFELEKEKEEAKVEIDQTQKNIELIKEDRGESESEVNQNQSDIDQFNKVIDQTQENIEQYIEDIDQKQGNIEQSELEIDSLSLSEEDPSFINLSSEEEFDFFEELFIYELPDYHEPSISVPSFTFTDNDINRNDLVIKNSTQQIWEYYFTLSFHQLDDLFVNIEEAQEEIIINPQQNMLWNSYFWYCRHELEQLGEIVLQQQSKIEHNFKNQIWKEYFDLKCNPLDQISSQILYPTLWKSYFYYNYHREDIFEFQTKIEIILPNQIWREYFQLKCYLSDEQNEITVVNQLVNSQDQQIEQIQYSNLYKQYFLQSLSNFDDFIELTLPHQNSQILFDEILIQLPIFMIIMLIIFGQNRQSEINKQLSGNLIVLNESFQLLIQNWRIVNRSIEQSQEQLWMQIEQFYCICQ